MNNPASLKYGDKIAIVATSGRLFEFEIIEALNYIQVWGYQPVLGKHLFEDYYNGYHYAGTDQQRLSDFQTALDDPEIKAIWIGRGGYGSVRILDLLNFDQFLKQPKWIIGYSDITIFHNYLNNLNVPTLHAVTAKKLNNVTYHPESYGLLELILKGDPLDYHLKNHRFNIPGKARGKLIGGNLSIVYSLLGSDTFPIGENLILFLEDWCENWYHVDRMMISLKRSGLLNRLSGVIIGAFNRMDIVDENPEFYTNYDSTTYRIIKEHLEDYNIPIAFQFPAGHIGDFKPMIFGKTIEFEVNDNGVSLKF